ncbi:MAG: sigma-70 family RNA polymerase sigma factor [Acidobacteriota bacterium]
MPKHSIDGKSESAEVAISRLFEARGGQLFALGMRLCGNPQQAEDLVQETFLQAFRKWDQFDGRSDPATWLYTIAVRGCRRLHRRRSGEPRHIESLSALLPSGESTIPDIGRTGEGPDSRVLQGEIRERVEDAISTLPVSFRIPLVLKDIAEFTIPQVAAIMGLKENTVKTRIHRARLFIRKKLATRLPQRNAPPPDHSRQVCLDLLRAKQEALDRGVDYPLAPDELCSRCSALFATLDLATDVCSQIGRGILPEKLRRRLSEILDP